MAAALLAGCVAPAPELWPPTANHGRADVLCDGASLAALASRDGTPAVHLSESPESKVAVLVARVIGRDPGRRRRMILVGRDAAGMTSPAPRTRSRSNSPRTSTPAISSPSRAGRSTRARGCRR